jgi:hypothetical protein
MSKKQYKTAAIANELAGASLYFTKSGHSNRSKEQPSAPITLGKEDQKSTPNLTETRNQSRGGMMENPRGRSRHLPSRDEIQEFSFQLRDELKVKVQAEVPHGWQSELEEIARQLRVKKLELYRFIIGEFLGKLKRAPNT